MKPALIDTKVFVQRGSPEWRAWQGYWVRVHGCSPPCARFESEGNKFGWRFDSKWPPGANLIPPLETD